MKNWKKAWVELKYLIGIKLIQWARPLLPVHVQVIYDQCIYDMMIRIMDKEMKNYQS